MKKDAILGVRRSNRRQPQAPSSTMARLTRTPDKENHPAIWSPPDDSVVTVPLVTPRKHNLRSVIKIDSEGGAEVTLGATPSTTASSSVTTPDHQASLRSRPIHSLLDMELTPSPMTSSPTSFHDDDLEWHVSTTPDDASPAYCGIVCDETGLPMSSSRVQEKISRFLGSPVSSDSWSHGWQAWSYFAFYDDNEPPPRSASSPEEFKSSIQRVLHNRACNVQARHQRLAALRRDLSPFHVSPTKTPPARTRSCQVYSTPPANKATRKAPVLQTPTPVKDLASLWQCGMHCAVDVDPSPARQRRPTHVIDDECYDSDPEDYRRSSRPSGRRVEDDENKENVPPQFSLRRVSSQQSEEDARAMVAELMNERLTLILHQNSQNAQAKTLRPHAVHMWIERGQSLKTGVIPPKLVWKAVHRTPVLRRHMFRPEIHSVPILDIHRILEVEKVDRLAHPFARTSNSFLIKTLDRTLMLEAPSQTERDRIVQSLKLLVARLGSMLLIKDDQLIEEFFAGMETCGPGEQPYWLEDHVV